MKLIFCTDNKRGMMFNKRRQSQDRILRARMLELARDARLLMSPYSAKQFSHDDPIIADPNFADIAGESDYCFIEDTDVSLDNCSEIVIYLWNRDYPADKFLSFDPVSLGFRLVSETDFAGSSHEKITEKIYVKE